MEMSVFIAVIVCVVTMAYVRNRRDEGKDMEMSQGQVVPQSAEVEGSYGKESVLEGNPEEVTVSTRDLFLAGLNRMGSQYEIVEGEDTDTVTFQWQGGFFTASMVSDIPFVTIWYPEWAEFELYDIEELSRVRRAVNKANLEYDVTVFYLVNEAGGTFTLHSKRVIAFPPEKPDTEAYLRYLFSRFFIVGRHVVTETERLKIEEESAKENSREWAG